MGNRCVITTKENFKENDIGIYLHWNGGVESVTAFLMYCDMLNARTPETDKYGWTVLVKVIANFFEDGLSCGIGCVNHLDCNNYDNGVYFIEDWKIVGRKFGKGKCPTDAKTRQFIKDMLVYIDNKQPKQLGKDFIENWLIKNNF